MGSGIKVTTTTTYGQGWVDMRNLHGAQADYYSAEMLRNAYEPPPERRIVLPGEVFRYLDEDDLGVDPLGR